MVASFVGLVLFVYSVAVLVTSISVWVYIFSCRRNNQPILEQRPIHRSTIGATDVAAVITFLILGLLLLLNTVGFLATTFGNAPKHEISEGGIWAQIIVQLVISTVLAITIIARGGQSIFFGQTWNQFLRDARIGVLAFCALCVPVIIIQAVAALLTPYEHALIQVMIDDPQWNILLPVLLAAVFVAPVTEEFFFRLVLQGWLEDFFGIRLRGASTQHSTSSDQFSINEEEVVPATLADPDEYPADTETPYSSPSSEEPPLLADAADMITPPYQPVPIIFSSLLFSLMHLGQGAAPIPLFFLALGLGYVFQRTRTMTASFVVHFMLNTQSMVLLLVQIFLGDSLGTPPV